MIIMECRHEELNNAIAGLNASKVPLVGLNSDTYTAAGFGDNIGIHYFIPWLTKTFGLSVDHAINIFLVAFYDRRIDCNMLFLFDF